jgi:prepilin-type processing-associated H-X9-DG protein
MNVEGVDVGPALDAATAPYADDAGMAPKLAFHGYKDSMVRRPAEKLMFVDASWITVNESGSGVSPGWNGKISNYDIILDRTNTGTIPGVGAYDSTRTTDWRHQGYANVCFFDGHVAALRKDEIYNLDSSGNIVGNDALWKVLQ